MIVHPQVHCLKRTFIYQYLITEPQGVILVDTGLPGNGKRTLNYLASNGIPPTKVTDILITHADGDHYGSVEELTRDCPVNVCSSEVEASAIRAGAQSRPLKMDSLVIRLFSVVSRRFFKAPPSRVDRILVPGEELPFLGGLQVMDTRGHTPGHLSFFSPSTGILFAGDSIAFKGNSPIPSFGANTWDEALARKSFELQMALNPGIICAGHGMVKLRN